MEALEKQQTACYHCGDVCQEEPIHFDQKKFCCHGCKSVYELISASDLHQYYQNQDLKAPKVAERVVSERKFQFLQLEEVSRELIRYRDEQKSVVRLYIPGVHCSSCIYLLEHLPKLEQRIFKSEVNFIRKELSITYDHRGLSLKDIALLLTSLGYEPSIQLDSLPDSANQKGKRNDIGLKIAIAGFCFGNSMLISLPEYLDIGFQLESNFRTLFGWVNLILALPVFLYASRDYFISSWKGLRHRYLTIDVPIVLGICTLFFRSIYEIIWQVGPGYVDSLNGLVFFLLLGRWYQSKTYEALSFDRDYTSYFPISVSRLNDQDKEELVLLKDLKAGDQIRLHNYELIPADGKLISGDAKLDYSFVTGESRPVYPKPGERIFAGGRQLGGQVVIALEKAVQNSELTQLWNNQAFSKTEANYNNLIDQVSRYFTAVIILLALGTGIYWWTEAPEKVWDAVTAVLIIACPCALALAMPFAFGHGTRSLGKKGIYLKNADVIETLARVKEVVFDKTGTLTDNGSLRLSFHGIALDDDALRLIKTATATSAHPLSRIIAENIADNHEKLPITSFDEVIGKGISAEAGGDFIRLGSASWLGRTIPGRHTESQVHIEMNGDYLGYYSFEASYRTHIFDTLKRLKHSGFKLHLLSGDNDAERSSLSPYFDVLGFDQKPKDKLAYISGIDSKSLMIGDGLNDAGALKSSDVGFAVCEDIHQFSPACDGMIQSGSLADLDHVLGFSKKVMGIVVIALLISFIYNVIGLSFAVSGQLTPIISAILMPLSSVTVVGFITLAVKLVGRRLQ